MILPFLISFLYLLLYLAVVIVVIEVILWVLGQLIGPIPPNIRKGLYIIVLLLFVIGVLSIFAGWHPALIGHY